MDPHLSLSIFVLITIINYFSFSEPVLSASFTGDCQCVVVGCSDDHVRLFDKDSGELLGE